MLDKIRGVSFTIDNLELHKMEAMPEYATIIRLHSIDGQNKTNIHYPLKHPPASYNSWQQLGRVMILINRIFKTAKFEEVQAVGSYVYTLEEFASFFNEYVEMPKPYYPKVKEEYMRHLTFYAQRLHFKGMLNIALLNATAIKFNVFTGKNFSIKEVYKKSYSVYMLDRSDWKVQKGKQSNIKSSQKRKELQIQKIKIIASHIEQFTNSKGKLNVNSLSSHLGISRSSLYSLLPKAKALADCSHITKPKWKNTETRALDGAKSSTILQSQNGKK